MTTASDLRAQRVTPLYYIKIDGIEPIFVQPHSRGAPSWSRTCRQALIGMSEHASKLDLGSMISVVDAMEFELADWQESDGTWYLGKLFAPGRWDTGAIVRIAAGTAHNQQIDADATTITVKSTTGFPASGTAYIGQETITYAGVTATSLTGVVKGLYPAVPTASGYWGYTYPRPMTSEGGALQHVSQYPFAIVGRRVALYVTTWDAARERWRYESGNNVIWTDAFGDSSVGAQWTQDANNGTITESSGELHLDVAGSTNASWDATYKNAPMVILPFAAVGASSSELTMAQVTMDQNQIGNLRYTCMGLIEDDQNAHWFRVNQSSAGLEGHYARANLIANVYSIGALSAGVADAWPATARIYYNGSSTTKTIEGSTSLLSGYASAWISYAGAAYALMETWQVGINPIGYVLATQNTTGGGSPQLDADFDNFSLTQYTEATDGALLLWCGRIGTDSSIRQDGRTGAWHLTCTSILEDLNRPLCSSLPVGYIHQINLMGNAKYRTFAMHEFDANGTWIGKKDVVVASGLYDVDGVCKAISDAANATSWVPLSGGSPDRELHVKRGDENIDACVYADGSVGKSVTVIIDPYGHYNHAWAALGFGGRGYIAFALDAGSAWNIVTGDQYYDDYHPVDRRCNGNRIYIYSDPGYWANQGDDSTTQAHVAIEDASLVSDPRNELTGTLYCRYTSVIAPPVDVAQLVIDHVHNPKYSTDGFVGKAHGDDPVKVRQVLLPRWDVTGSTKRGPFGQLCWSLLSTGTDAYNEESYTYDALPLAASVCMQEDLVDIQSFLDADADVMARCPTLASRPLWPWNPGDSWADRAKRECLLFGYAIVWRRGQISCVRVLSTDTDLADVTLSPSLHSGHDSMPDQTTGLGTVVNQYSVTIASQIYDKKYSVVITDGDSTLAYQAVKDVAIEHGGLPVDNGLTYVKGLLDAELTGRPLRQASPEVDVPVVHALIYRLWVGMILRYTATNIADPSGSGTRSVDCLATVTSVQWDYAAGKGTVSLQLHARYARLGTPYAPAALVDIAATNGGWSDANDRLTLVALTYGETGDPDDGAALAPTGGEQLLIIERAPSDPTSPLSWQVTVKASTPYETDGAQILSLAAGTTLAAWDADKEYIVTYADWDLPVVAAQESLGTWQADATTELLASGGDNDSPQRYG